MVIPSFRRPTRLAFALEALAAQTLPADSFEVLVVGDPSDPDLAREWPAANVRVLEVAATGPARRRNVGWRAGAADLVAFTDDDCRPSPDWLSELLAAGGELETILQGPTLPDPSELHLLYGIARSIRIEGPDRWYPSCNIAYPRALLERLGGFDESLSFFGEDTDLGLRAEAIGARLRFVDGALVHHAVHVRRLGDALRDATERHAEAAVLARHPEHRSELEFGAFISREHALLTLAWLGLGLGLLRSDFRLTAAGTLPYLGYKLARKRAAGARIDPAGIARLAIDIAAETVVDAVEITMRARSSLKHGQLVL